MARLERGEVGFDTKHGLVVSLPEDDVAAFGVGKYGSVTGL